MSEIAHGHELTPQQSADVIRYYNDGENAAFRRLGWKDKVAMGRSAMHAIESSETLLPTGKPMLTSKEMGEGLDILMPPVKLKYLAEDVLEAYVDKRGISFNEALDIFEADGYDVSPYR